MTRLPILPELSLQLSHMRGPESTPHSNRFSFAQTIAPSAYLSRMLLTTFFAISLWITPTTPTNSLANETKSDNSFRITGYLPDYRFAEFTPDSAQLLTDLILFSAEPLEDGKLDTRRLTNCPWNTLHELKAKHSVRLHLSIGGWERSTNFAKIASSHELRKSFTENVVNFALKNRLDGIDVDWEHPKNEKENEDYGQLLHDLRLGLQPHELTLTVTVAAWQAISITVGDSADYVQLMSYDHDGKHATLEAAKQDLKKLIAKGIPAAKILLGVPFYGRHQKTRSALSYHDIVQTYAPKPDIDEVEQIYFNGPNTIRRKVALAREQRIAGIMFWELGQDTSGNQSLLNAIFHTAKDANIISK